MGCTFTTGVIPSGFTHGAAGGIRVTDMGDATRWLTYDDMATVLGIAPESAKRLAMRRKWPRRPGNDGRALVAVPEDRIAQAATGDATDDIEGGDTAGVTGDVTDEGRGDARALIAFLERRIDELSEELVEARTEARGVRFEAEALRVQAGRVDVLAALLDVERTRVVEARAETQARVEAGRALLEAVQSERDRLLIQVEERRRPWWGRLVGQRWT